MCRFCGAKHPEPKRPFFNLTTTGRYEVADSLTTQIGKGESLPKRYEKSVLYLKEAAALLSEIRERIRVDQIDSDHEPDPDYNTFGFSGAQEFAHQALTLSINEIRDHLKLIQDVNEHVAQLAEMDRLSTEIGRPLQPQ